MRRRKVKRNFEEKEKGKRNIDERKKGNKEYWWGERKKGILMRRRKVKRNIDEKEKGKKKYWERKKGRKGKGTLLLGGREKEYYCTEEREKRILL